jgi:hypothetical protein
MGETVLGESELGRRAWAVSISGPDFGLFGLESNPFSSGCFRKDVEGVMSNLHRHGRLTTCQHLNHPQKCT